MRSLWSYVYVVLTVAATLVLRLLLRPWTGAEPRYIYFFTTVLVSGFLWGAGPGLLAAFLSTIIAGYLLAINGHHPIGVTVGQSVLFLIESVFVCYLLYHLRKAQLKERADRQLMQSLIDHSPNAIFVKNKKGEYLLSNKAAAEEVGLTEQDREVLRTGKAFVFEETIKIKDEPHVFLATKFPFMDAKEHVAGICGILADISERKRQEERSHILEKASTALSARLEYGNAIGHLVKSTIPDFADICMVDALIGPEKLRRIAVAHIDKEHEETIRAKLAKYPPRFDLPHPLVAVVRSSRDHLDLRRIAYNQEHFELLESMNLESVIVVPIHGRVGLLGAISFASTRAGRCFGAEDLYTAKELAWRASIAIENEALFKKTKEAIGLRDKFMSIVSHDLKSPLAALRLNAQLLGVSCPGEKCAEIAVKTSGQLRKAVEVMSNLVSDLLDVGVIEANRLKIASTTTDVSGLAKRCLEVLQPLAEAKRVSLSWNIPESGSVDCDPERICQVLTNLVGNAIKFSPEGESIEVGFESTASGARFSVKDKGPGISEADILHVFEKLWQAKGVEKLGSGLGLYIARAIVEAHGGTIGVESKVGDGSTFWFTLPVKDVKLAEAG